MESLSGKVILVTGAAKRIGRGIALRLAREGARVAIHYNGSEAEARRTAAECGDAGGACRVDRILRELFREPATVGSEGARVWSAGRGHRVWRRNGVGESSSKRERGLWRDQEYRQSAR